MITYDFPSGPWPFSLIFYIAKQTTKKVCMQTWIPLQPNLIVLSNFFVLIALLLWLLYFSIYCMCVYIYIYIWFNHWEHATFEKYLCCAILFFGGGGSISIFAFLFFLFLMCFIVRILNLMITSKSTLRDLIARDLSKQAESCNAQCGKMLKGPSSLKVYFVVSFYF